MGKIVTVWSPVSHTGVTTTAILMANKLAKGHSVCLIDFDLNNADAALYLNISDIEHNIDNLLPYIQGHNLTEDIFNMNLIKVNNFMFMQGTRKIDKGPTFTIEHLEPIVEMAEKLFDIVVINTNTALDNAGTFIALKKADKVVMILCQNVFHFKKYIDKAQLVGTLLSTPLVAVNMYSKNIVLSLDNIKENLNTDVYPLAEIDRIGVINDINTQTSIFEIFSGKRTKRYTENLDAFTDRLLVELGMKDEKETAKKKRFFGL